eukprot:maker-scaffold_5-snap-gene-16.10-mRNA-1 protein AED:0.02 eAED:0.03 QI:0/0/0/1/0/0/2/0/449
MADAMLRNAPKDGKLRRETESVFSKTAHGATEVKEDETMIQCKKVLLSVISTLAIEEVHGRYEKATKENGFLPTKVRESLFSESGGIEVLNKHHKLNLFVINNDGQQDSLIWLLNMKEIFSKQLPKMPKEYIIRLCFDEKHYTLVCVRTDFLTNKREIVGGVCFRPFLDQRFAEIAFLAVSADHQVSGYGTIVMNHLKHYAQTIDTHDKKLTHFLTYADNYAIGYFKKQGFTKEITISQNRYLGYIKDYDGANLMECAISPFVDYLNLKRMLKNQKKFLIRKLKELREIEPVYPGLKARTFFKSGTKRKIDSIYDIPGVKEAGWTKPLLELPLGSIYNKIGDTSEKGKKLRSELKGLLKKIKNNANSWPFLEPVPNTVTDYLDVVKDPVDLSLIEARLNGGYYYTSLQIFKEDVKKMLDNCKLYNAEDTEYYKAAQELQDYFNKICAKE